jgi:hypothetical protein
MGNPDLRIWEAHWGLEPSTGGHVRATAGVTVYNRRTRGTNAETPRRKDAKVQCRSATVSTSASLRLRVFALNPGGASVPSVCGRRKDSYLMGGGSWRVCICSCTRIGAMNLHAKEPSPPRHARGRLPAPPIGCIGWERWPQGRVRDFCILHSAFHIFRIAHWNGPLRQAQGRLPDVGSPVDA